MLTLTPKKILGLNPIRRGGPQTRITHIDTLADDTPKSRRRVRGLCPGVVGVSLVSPSAIHSAQSVARCAERQGAANDLAERQAGKANA